MSCPSANASLGAAATTRGSPTMGMTPSSTSTISAAVAPASTASSARAPYEGTAPSTATRAAIRASASVLGSSALSALRRVVACAPEDLCHGALVMERQAAQQVGVVQRKPSIRGSAPDAVVCRAQM